MRHLDRSGQVIVEYTFMLAAIVAIVLSVMGIIKERMNTDATVCAPGQFNAVCVIKNQLQFGGEGDNPAKFKRFRLMRGP